MIPICRFIHAIKYAVSLALGLLGVPAMAFAQEAPPSSGGSLWTLSYGLVIAGIALGLLVVLRPSNRRERAKKEQ